MNNNDSNVFDLIRVDAGNNDVAAALDKLAASLTESGQHHPLFEALKMQTRHRLNLPLIYDPQREKLDAETQAEFDNRLLDACRTVGQLLIADQKLGEAWVYLQPLDDRELVEPLIENYQVTDDNADEVIDIALMQLAAPATGFRLVLERYGTCDAISTFESIAHTFDDAATRARLAEMLTAHLHRELVEHLKNHLAEHKLASDLSFKDLVQTQDKVQTDAGPLVDMTHLASTLRIGRCANSRDAYLQLCELAEYGCLFDEFYEAGGDWPFEHIFDDHLIYFGALAADTADVEVVAQAIKFFDDKSKSTQDDPFHPVSDEVFVDLLFRLGRNTEAIKVSLERLSKREELVGIAPSVHQMATEPEHFRMLESHYLAENDLLGFTVAVLSGTDK